MPPALAGPATLAITGFGHRLIRCRIAGKLAHPFGAERGDRRLLQVHPGAEHRTGVGEHDDPDRRRSAATASSASTELGAQLRRQRVAVVPANRE